MAATMSKPQYNYKHEQVRAALRRSVDAGQAWCAEDHCLMPTRWIPPGTPWDLAHNRATGGYLGPAHAKCNRTEGGKHSPTRGWRGVNVHRRVSRWNSRQW